MTSNSLFPFQSVGSYAELPTEFYAHCSPAAVPNPQLLKLNESLAEELGLDPTQLRSEEAVSIFAGSEFPMGATPLAQAYAGHQFGGFVPQLGDGRALLLGEVEDAAGRRRDIALKGSGRTAFSRGGDGKAAVGPVLREYLVAEAMHALKIPTTRALAAVSTGESVYRERRLPGAVLTRVAANHVRVGTFQYFASREQTDHLRALAAFVIERHDPHLRDEEQPYLQLLTSVVDRQAKLVAQWMLVGFIHGVMNTDNMTISGETIDYGPCAFMENYDPQTVFSSIDHGGRYAYRNQPPIALWNLSRFAETLLPLMNSEPSEAVASATAILEEFPARYEAAWLQGMRAKLGLVADAGEVAQVEKDQQLAEEWLTLLEQHSIDYTLAFRWLSEAATGDTSRLQSLFPSADALQPWLERWQGRAGQLPQLETATRMRRVNPIYVPRNHLVEEALASASDDSDLTKFEQLLAAITRPFEERAEFDDYAQPAPAEFTSCYKTFCGT